MEEPRPAFVCDASVLIALIDGGLLALVAQVFDLLVPDVILHEEILDPPGENLLQERLVREIHLSGTLVLKVFELRKRFSAPSTHDLFALAVADQERLILLTGDRHLRRAAEKLGVEVHGVLWVLDELVNGGHLAPHEAAESLRKIRERGTYLPEEECEIRLKRWKNPQDR